MPKLADKIEAMEKQLIEQKDSLVAATEALEAAPDEESLLTEVEALTEGVEQTEKNLGALKKAEKALAIRAEATPPAGEGQAPATIKATPKYKGNAPGDLLVKHGVISLLSFIEKKEPLQIMEERYPEHNVIKETFMVAKDATNPATTFTTGWAAELVQDDLQGFMEALSEQSVCAALQSYCLSLNFGGYNSITIPKEIPLGSNPKEPAWVMESRPIPVTQFGYESETINRYKLAAITTFTREIADRSTPAIEGILRNSLNKVYAKVLDQAFLGNLAAVANVRPAGIIAGVTPIAGTAGGGDAAVRTDITNMLAAMMGANIGVKPVLIMSTLDQLGASMMVSSLSEYLFKDELSSGQLMSIPVISSGHVPQHDLYLVDANYMACAFDTPTFDTSDVATIVEASANANAPTMAAVPGAVPVAGTAGQVGVDEGMHVSDAATNVPATNARSLWQTYSVGIRMIAPTSWGKMHDEAVQFIDDTSWT